MKKKRRLAGLLGRKRQLEKRIIKTANCNKFEKFVSDGNKCGEARRWARVF